MNEEEIKVSEKVCDVKMCNLKDVLGGHESKLMQHDTRFIQNEERLKSLEDYNIQAKIDSAILQKQQAEQKSLTLELHAKQREKNEKEFLKIDKQFEKNEISTEKKFDNQAALNKGQFDFQNTMLTKLIEGQNITKTAKIEITKGKLLFIIALLGVIQVLVQKFL